MGRGGKNHQRIGLVAAANHLFLPFFKTGGGADSDCAPAKKSRNLNPKEHTCRELLERQLKDSEVDEKNTNRSNLS